MLLSYQDTTMENIHVAIQSFCDAVIKIRTSQTIHLSVLQKGTACMDVINSFPCVKQRITSHHASSIQNCQEFSQLLQCIPPTLLDLISGK